MLVPNLLSFSCKRGQGIDFQRLHRLWHLLIVVLFIHLLLNIGQHFLLLVGRNRAPEVQQDKLHLDLARQHLLHKQRALLLHFIGRHRPFVLLQRLIDRRQQIARQNGLVTDKRDLLGRVRDHTHQMWGQRLDRLLLAEAGAHQEADQQPGQRHTLDGQSDLNASHASFCGPLLVILGVGRDYSQLTAPVATPISPAAGFCLHPQLLAQQADRRSSCRQSAAAPR